jgi:transposase
MATPVVRQLCALPGIGHYTALLILAEIGEIERLPDPKHLVSYAGLAPTVHGTGGRVYTGHISKQGSRWLRWILIEAAIHASGQPGRYQQLFERIAQRKGRKLARVVVAHELLATIYWMLRHAH